MPETLDDPLSIFFTPFWWLLCLEIQPIGEGFDYLDEIQYGIDLNVLLMTTMRSFSFFTLAKYTSFTQNGLTRLIPN